MEIRTFGTGRRIEECRRVICDREDELLFRRLFLLPIPTSRDKKTITGTDVPLSELVEKACFGDAVAGYGIPENIKEKLLFKGAEVYDGGEDEDFLFRNAEVTARGALGYILTENERDLTELSVGIIGYGRIGSCLLRYLLFLGASVTVYTTREAVAFELCESGVKASVSFDALLSQDILVNTDPRRQLSERCALDFMERARIIDLASGRVFPESKNLVKLSSIPEKMYPITAGRLYAEHIIEYLSGEGRV